MYKRQHLFLQIIDSQIIDSQTANDGMLLGKRTNHIEQTFSDRPILSQISQLYRDLQDCHQSKSARKIQNLKGCLKFALTATSSLLSNSALVVLSSMPMTEREKAAFLRECVTPEELDFIRKKLYDLSDLLKDEKRQRMMPEKAPMKFTRNE